MGLKLKDLVKENSFDGAPAGSAGTINYQAPLNTQNSAFQDPSKFQSSNNNKAVNQFSNTAKDVPDPVNMEKEIDQIYSKKKVPTSDEVLCGLEYELHNMIKPDKRKAKEIVLQNLRRDPDYYGEMHMLNADDKAMDVNIKETQKIFDELQKGKEQIYDVNPNIVSIMRELKQQKKNSDKVLQDSRIEKLKIKK